MNNLNRTKKVFVSDGSSLPANNSAITAMTSGQVAIYGADMTALDPGATDTITTQPFIYIIEKKTGSDGTVYTKRSTKIDGMSVISYKGESYVPQTREVWAIGYNRKTATGLLETNNSTDYKFRIVFKNDKHMYSLRPETSTIQFTTDSTATQLEIATAITSAINTSAYNTQISAVTVGDGTGVYGLTGASNYGSEIQGLEPSLDTTTTYTNNVIYFSVHVDDSTGFGTTSTCTQIQAGIQGSGTYNEVYFLENMAFGTEGVANRRLWPIPALDYSSTSALILSSAIVPTVTGTISEDKVTFSATVAAILRVGEKVELGGVNYTIKYFVSSTVAVLTSTLTGNLSASAAKVRYKYDIVTIEYNDVVNTPVGVPVMSNKVVIIAIPSITPGNAYTTLSGAGTDIQAILNAWMATTPKSPANISI